MATYVLVSGAWHGRWCWSEVVPLLEAAGHAVLAPDLRGMGDDYAAVGEASLAGWADQIAALVAAQAEPVVLVGHSRGGLVISEVAERVPDRLARLIYLCAFLLRDGQTLNELARTQENYDAMVAAGTMHGDGTSSLKAAAIAGLFYNATAADRVAIAQRRVGREPLSSFVTPIHVTEARFGSVPRAYIECINDLAIPLSLQRAMQAALPCGVTMTLESDHSPFFSMPRALSKALIELGRAA